MTTSRNYPKPSNLWTFSDNRKYSGSNRWRGSKSKLLKMLRRYIPQTNPQTWWDSGYEYQLVSPEGDYYKIYVSQDNEKAIVLEPDW